MEIAKLILEYIKMLVWPFLIFCIVIVFRDPLTQLLSRLEQVEGLGIKVITGGSRLGAPITTGFETVGLPPDVSADEPPDVHYNLIRTDISLDKCAGIAEDALEEGGFENIGRNPRPDNITVYGYDGQSVGAVWCTEQGRLTFIVTAGPYQASFDKRVDLESAFRRGFDQLAR